MLYKILEDYPKLTLKHARNIALPESGRVCVRGAQGIGKTEAILKALATERFKQKRKMYIDLHDTRLDLARMLADLPAFLSTQKIDILVLDHADLLCDFKLDLSLLILITQNQLLGVSFDISLSPLTFAEFSALRGLQYDEAFSLYLKYGNLFHQLKGKQKGEFLRSLCADGTDFWLLKMLILNLGQKVSLNQIFTLLKRDGKISKDRFYGYCRALECGQNLFWLEKFEHQSAPKKLYFWDFTLKNSVSFLRNFSLLFENMVFLELKFAKNLEIFYTDRLDFFAPEFELAIICAPFLQGLELRLNRLGREREMFSRLLVISLNERGGGELLGVEYEIMPFVDFATLTLN